MDLYLPIANLSVNALVIVGLGGIVGLLSGMFGVGGGFLMTPLLIFLGVPPTVAVGTSPNLIVASSVSGMMAHWRRGNVDFRMGALLFSGGIGLLMAKESIQALIALKTGRRPQARKRRHHPLVAALPMRWRFYRSGLYISPLAPLLLGMATGILTMLLGVGGGFILVPAMLYLLGITTQSVVGTSLFQILFVTMATTMMHAMTTKAVDLVLAMLLLIGSVTGAQVGTRLSMTIRPEYLRVLLALIVLLVAARMALGLGWRPDEIFTIELN